VKLLLDARGNDAHQPMGPARITHDQGPPPRIFVAIACSNLVEDVILLLLAAEIELVQFRRQSPGVGALFGHEQVEGQTSIGHPPGRVDPWCQIEANVSGGKDLPCQTGPLGKLPDRGIRLGIHTAQPTPGQNPVGVYQGHEIGHRADSGQGQILASQAGRHRKTVSGCLAKPRQKQKGQAGRAEIPEHRAGRGLLGIDQDGGRGHVMVRDFMMIDYKDVGALPTGLTHRAEVVSPAVHGHKQAGIGVVGNGPVRYSIALFPPRNDDGIVGVVQIPQEMGHLGHRGYPVAIVIADEHKLVASGEMLHHEGRPFGHSLHCQIGFEVSETAAQERGPRPSILQQDR